MDFTALKTAIQNAVKLNGNEEITGDILQGVLLSMVTTLGDSAINDLVTAISNEVTARQNGDSTLNGYITSLQGAVNSINTAIGNGFVYAGIATPTTTPATGKVFYIALTAGTYTNFGNTEVSQGINILKYDGSDWSLDVVIALDNAPTPSSNNLVKSGGVFDKVLTDGSAFDISAHFASGGTLATYADLSAALTALNTLSASYKKGGMSIKFVQSSDNKYVQARLVADSFTIDITQWQSVDNKLTALSKNLIINRAVEDEISKIYDLNGNLVIRNILSGTKQVGYLYNGDTKEYVYFGGNDVEVLTITSGFSAGQRLLFIGENYEVAAYKVVCFLDSSDNIIESYKDNDNLANHFIHLLTVPSNTSKVIINGYKGNAEMASFDVDKNYNLKMAKDQLNSNVFKIAGSGLYTTSGYNAASTYSVFYSEPIEVIEGNTITIQSNLGFHLTFFSSKSSFTSQTAISHTSVSSGYDNYVGKVPTGAKAAIISISNNQEIRVINTNKIINDDCLIKVTQLPNRDLGLVYSFNSKYDTVKNADQSGNFSFAPVIFDKDKYVYSSFNVYKLLGYINCGIENQDVFLSFIINPSTAILTLFTWPYAGGQIYQNYNLTFVETPASDFLLYKTEYDSVNNNIVVNGIDASGNAIRAIARVEVSDADTTTYLQGLCNNCIKCSGFVAYVGSNFISYGIYDTLGEGWTKYKNGSTAKWYGKNGVTFGDSLTDQGYYVSALQNNFGMTIENCGVSGVKYTYDPNEPLYPAIYTQVANAQSANPDFIFIMGGTNDYSVQDDIGDYTDTTDATVCGGCYLAFTAIRAKWPLAPVFVGLIPLRDTSALYPSLPAGIDGNDANHTLLKYNNAIEIMAKRFGFNVIDSMECGIGPGNMGTYYQDGLHFNTAGGMRFAQFMVDKMDVITPY